ncbi:MAG TPA: hypothetical protein VMY35_15240 [Phycisphaerae bacterium]|nr:hypothetical protein [Phycisphaerae bacterium]
MEQAEKGLVKREEFGAVQDMRAPETASTAVAARERAAIEAMYIMAERHPRNVDQFRVGILKDCQRPGFAGVARFRRPVGKGKNPVTGEWEQVYAEGPSIRFIEAALQHWGNVFPSVTTVYDDDDLRICRATVTDLERNITWGNEIQIQKRVEKRGFGRNQEPPKGREIISQRLNSDGDKTYLVAATDDEIIVRQNALLSKTIRTLGQRLLPQDIIEEAMAAVLKTQADADKKDPDAAKRKLIDAFATIGVVPDMLQEYLDHPLEQITPKELGELRAIYTSIAQGDMSWGEVMDERGPEGSVDEQEQKMAEQLTKLWAKEKSVKKPEPRDDPEQKMAMSDPDPNESEEDRANRKSLEAHRAKYEQPATGRRQMKL